MAVVFLASRRRLQVGDREVTVGPVEALVLEAMSGEWPSTMDAIAEYACTSIGTVQKIVQSLRRKGVSIRTLHGYGYHAPMRVLVG